MATKYNKHKQDCGHLRFPIRTVLATVDLQVTSILPIKMYMAQTNVWGSKFDLAVKKVKRQHGTIILAILVDLLSPIICANIRAQGLFGSGEEDF